MFCIHLHLPFYYFSIALEYHISSGSLIILGGGQGEPLGVAVNVENLMENEGTGFVHTFAYRNVKKFVNDFPVPCSLLVSSIGKGQLK
ncbi:hypothetical protein BC6307_06975 [Sutcliffiella cohnii]|uniref:Uncharacterized protein n=1 Tax=Sutcliffiella cohnii TaxID=33932 RepID=A0A223KNL3_9BACI|nr:hypothetical protein BC6307_06975 [Sutcliffiella cohnii]